MSDDHETVHIGYDSRLSVIETNHLQLQKDVSTLTKDVSSLSASVKSMSESIKTIAHNQNVGMRTNWGVFFSGFGVLILVLGLVVYEPLVSLQNAHHDHADDGHPRLVLNELARVEQIVDANESALESRLDRKQVQLASIERRLDEISASDARNEERLLDVEREVYSGAAYRAGRPIRPSADNLEKE